MASTTTQTEPLAPDLGDHAPDGPAVIGAEAPGAHPAPAKAFGLIDAPMFIALAMLVVFAIIIWKRVPAAIGKALDKKIGAIREQLAEAEALREEAEALKGEYAAKAASAEAEAAAMVERARHEADAILVEALVERRGRMAEEKIAAEERAAVDQLRASAADAARIAAKRLIVERVDAAAAERLIDAAIGGLGR